VKVIKTMTYKSRSVKKPVPVFKKKPNQSAEKAAADALLNKYNSSGGIGVFGI